MEKKGWAMRRTALFDGPYRYSLLREWEPASRRLVFVMLNPSTADARRDDPTIRRCIGFARRWGFGSVEVVNLFAYRSPHPAVLRRVEDPVGPENDAHLLEAMARASLLIAAWGAQGALRGRDQEVIALLGGRTAFRCLGVTRAGHPRHPLYLRREVRPLPWNATPDGRLLATG